VKSNPLNFFVFSHFRVFVFPFSEVLERIGFFDNRSFRRSSVPLW